MQTTAIVKSRSLFSRAYGRRYFIRKIDVKPIAKNAFFSFSVVLPEFNVAN
jgi:hypothetical protein